MTVRLAWVVIILGFATALAACGQGGSSGEGEPLPLSCGGEDHPCSYAESSSEAINATLDLAEQAGSVIVDGGSIADAAAFLEGDDRVVELAHDDDAIRFRLAGGREHWIYSDNVYGNRSGIGKSSDHRVAVAGSPVLGNIVAESSDAKSAIVLSPSLYDFEESDEGAAVAVTLANTRGYEGRVTYLANTSVTDSTIGFGTYKDLDAHDVIHISTHGSAICDDTFCGGSIQAFSYDSIADILPGDTIDEKLMSITEPGVGLGQDPETDALGFTLSADFFKHHYPGGIDDAVIYLSACETMASAGTDLVSAIKGPTSVYIGWDASVRSDYAAEAAIAMYRNLADLGYSVDDALSAIGSLATPPDKAVMRTAGRSDSNGLRVRDLVTLLDPSSMEPLVSSAAVPIDGTVGDDLDDSVAWAIRVDGITAEVAADTEVRITIDGVETVAKVSSGTPDEDDSWIIEGLLDLGYGLEADTVVDYEAVVDLPEGGESDELMPIELVGKADGSWSLQIDYTFTDIHDGERTVTERGTANLILEPSDTQLFDDRIDYDIVGGTATVDYSYDSYRCVQTGSPVTWNVTPQAAAGSLFTVRLSADPPTITASVTIDGPEFSGEIKCRAGTGDDADPDYKDPEPTSFATSPLFLTILPDDAYPMNADGTFASGTVTREATGDFGWISESTFTFQPADS